MNVEAQEKRGGALCFGALACRPNGAGVSTYQRELLARMPALLAGTALSAVVQADAVAILPPGISAVARPVAAGARRAWHGIAPNDEQLASALAQLEETLGDY